MAIVLSDKKRLNSVRIISRVDGAIDHEKSDWDKYDEDPIANESALVMADGGKPTIFLCSFEFSAKEAQVIKDARMGALDEDRRATIAQGKYSFAVVKYALKEIRNPEGVKDVIPLKKDSRGYVSEETLALLERFGIVEEIWSHYINLTHTEVKKNLKN